MTLIVTSVVVVVLLIAVLAICLYLLGGLLNRIADNLEDCSHSVRRISLQAKVIRPGITRLNNVAKDLTGAMPLIVEGAERLVAAKSATPPEPQHVGYMDVTPPPAAEKTPRHAAQPQPAAVGVGYMD